MKKRFRTVVSLVVFLLLALISWDIEAEEIAFATTSGTVMQLEASATAYEQKDKSSKVIAEFSAGESVFVTGTDELWIEIFYKGDIGYIPTEQISNETMSTAEKSAQELGVGLTEEIKKNDLETSIAIDNYLRKQKQGLNSIIWKVAIGVLVVAVIVVSIFIGIMNQNAIKEIEAEKENNADDESKKDDDKGNNDNSEKEVDKKCNVEEKNKEDANIKNNEEHEKEIEKTEKVIPKYENDRESDEVRKQKKRKMKR